MNAPNPGSSSINLNATSHDLGLTSILPDLTAADRAVVTGAAGCLRGRDRPSFCRSPDPHLSASLADCDTAPGPAIARERGS